MTSNRRSPYPPPAMRRLRVYAFDPQASTRLETARMNLAIIELPWEQEGWEEPLRPGPVNEYLEVVDVDPASGQFYDAVDLDDPHLLAQDGLAPSEGDPRFHQQMVFVVAMKTIRVFERALGRKILWSPRRVHRSPGTDADGEVEAGAHRYEPVQRLRIYPHALREANAYYSPEKKALLFGYFRAASREAGASWVFTALSHDVIVHETTHAILDGLHRRYAEPTSVDSLAFHEAFADIVALLQHFTMREAVAGAIAARGGRLDGRSLLSGLAHQFGHATRRAGPLREAIDRGIADGATTGGPSSGGPSSGGPSLGGVSDAQRRGLPRHDLLDSVTKPHARGAILVAAIFDALVTIYQRRTADLMRLAGASAEASGPGRELHPDLVARLTREATKSAEHVLRMCIRALDYLPPVDVRFGEFLRAIITADTDLVPDDPLGYRLAVIEAFRLRGIVAEGCLSLAPDSLLWESPAEDLDVGTPPKVDLAPKYRRADACDTAGTNQRETWRWLHQSQGPVIDRKWEISLGVLFPSTSPDAAKGLRTVTHRPGRSTPAVEVHSVRTTRRTGPDGQDLRQLIIEVAQRRRGFMDAKIQSQQDSDAQVPVQPPDFEFRGGATLIFDLRDNKLRYAIRKRIDDDGRLAVQRAFLKARAADGLALTYGLADAAEPSEPFAMLHREL